MNRSLLGVAALLGLAAAPFPPSPASASCAAPRLDVEQLVLRAATPVTVTGEGFVDGCRDTMSCSEQLGCHSCEYDDPPPQPAERLTLHLRQGGRSWALGTVDADRDGTATWSFTVPPEVRPGPARLVPEGGEAARVRVR